MGNTSSLVTINVKNDKFYLDYKEFLKFKEVRDLVNEDNKIYLYLEEYMNLCLTDRLTYLYKKPTTLLVNNGMLDEWVINDIINTNNLYTFNKYIMTCCSLENQYIKNNFFNKRFVNLYYYLELSKDHTDQFMYNYIQSFLSTFNQDNYLIDKVDCNNDMEICNVLIYDNKYNKLLFTSDSDLIINYIKVIDDNDLFHAKFLIRKPKFITVLTKVIAL